jgi:hypothetical protein
MAGYIGTKAVNLSTTGADINGNANVDGTLDVLGAFTSLGIDDNATSTAVTIDASQNVGIGTLTPSYPLDIAGIVNIVNGANGRLNIGATTNYLYGDSGGNVILGNSGGDRLQITASGNVGIGTAAPAFASGKGLVVHNPTAAADTRLRLTNAANGTGLFDGMDITLASDGSTNLIGWEAQPMKFYTAGTERMQIDAGGSVLIGKTSTLESVSGCHFYGSTNAGAFDVARATRMGRFNLTGANGTSIEFAKSGATVGSISVTGSAAAYNTSSDYRLKENITPIQGAADIVKAMRPATYTFKADGSWADGFIAHELQELHPVAVTGSKDAMRDEEYEATPAVYEDVIIPAVEAVAEVLAVYDDDGVLVSEGVPAVEAEPERTEQRLVSEAVMDTRSVPDYQGVDYSKLTPILTAALQEALNKIDELTARIETLEAK